MRPVHTISLVALALWHLHGTCVAQSGQAHSKNKNNKTPMTTTLMENKEVIRALYDEALNKRNMALLGELVSDTYTGIGGKKGAAAFQEPVGALIKAFPDIHWKIEELIGDSNKVVIRWTWTGTHTGAFQHLAPSHKKISNEGLGIYTLSHGKIMGAQVHTDRLGFLQSLNVVPTDLTQLAAKSSAEGHVRFVDKFVMPAAAKQEFLQRVVISRQLIRTLPGFIEDAAFERTDEHGNMVYMTMAVWENEDAVKQAREAMQAQYKKEGFDPAAFMQRLNVTMERGLYKDDVLR